MEWILAIIDEINKVTQSLGLRGKGKKNEDHSHQHANQAEQTKRIRKSERRDLSSVSCQSLQSTVTFSVSACVVVGDNIFI